MDINRGLKYWPNAKWGRKDLEEKEPHFKQKLTEKKLRNVQAPFPDPP